jgi:hypothetical protein
MKLTKEEIFFLGVLTGIILCCISISIFVALNF